MKIKKQVKREIKKEGLYGVNPVLEALRSNKRDFQKIVVDKGRADKGVIKEILYLAETKNIPVSRVNNSELDRIADTRKHQGVVGVVSPVKAIDIYDLLDTVLAPLKEPVVALLDGVEDPGNLGSIIRSAEVLGVNGIIIPKNRAAGISPMVVKRSAGATEYLPITTVTNITNAIKELKKRDFMVIGLEKGADRACHNYDYKGPIAIVIGGESKGIRPLVQKNCDFIVSIRMKGKVSSLNCATAAALIFYEITRTRLKRSV